MRLHINAGDNIREALKASDVRFECGGAGYCGKCVVHVVEGTVPATDTDRRFLDSVRIEEGFRLACAMGTAASDIEIETVGRDRYVPDERGSYTGSDAAERDYCFAIDIGTTTLAIAAVDCADGKVFDGCSCVNRQRMYGADVISRIVAANNGHGPEMRDLVISDIDSGINAIMRRNGLRVERLEQIVIAGNTTMQHIFAGESCEGLAAAPFAPISLDMRRTESGLILPGISAFVGADILSGIYECGFDGRELCMLIDLGTNGEMALGSRDRILVASTAAGPAFEGGNISCGTASVAGAVYDVELSDTEGVDPVRLHTIGNAEPAGLCGTGVIALIAELLENGLIDRTGLIDERLGRKIKLTSDGSVTFTQKDIREFQLAKAAIRAGIETLMFTFGAVPEDISRVYVAGGFSEGLDIRKACITGLLPKELEDAAVQAGNTSLKGAVKFAGRIGTSEGTAELERLKSVCKEINLADNAFFKEHFIEYMNF